MATPAEAVGPSGPAASAPVRLAGYQGGASILTRALHRFAEALQAADPPLACTVQDDVTAAGQTARALFDSVEAGTREVCYLASGYLAARVPELAVLDLPFSVHDRAQALATLDGAVGAVLAAAVHARTGLRVLGFWDNGFRHLSNRLRPVRTPADCAGLVVRTLDSEDYRATLRAIGCSPVTLDVKELREAVASGRVDAQENPLTNLVLFGLHAHHRHVSLTGHLFGVALLVAHGGWFDGLGTAQRARVATAAHDATQAQRAWAAAQDDEALAVLRADGVQVLTAQEIDLPAFREACAPMLRERLAALPPPLVAAYLQR